MTLLGQKRVAKVVIFIQNEPFSLRLLAVKLLRPRNTTLLRNHTLFAIIRSECIWERLAKKCSITFCICFSCGPIFGAGADLLISHSCNTTMESYSNLPHSYDGPNASCKSLLGDYNFSVMDYEVYTTAVATNPPQAKQPQHERF